MPKTVVSLNVTLDTGYGMLMGYSSDLLLSLHVASSFIVLLDTKRAIIYKINIILISVQVGSSD